MNNFSQFASVASSAAQRKRALVLAVAILWPCCFVLQTTSTIVGYQDQRDSDAGRNSAPPSKQRLGEIAGRLKQSLNGKAVVRNLCESRGQTIQVEESTEISEISECKMTFKTRKVSSSTDSRRELVFTIYANLAELTTPVSVEKQTFPQCQSTDGGVVKVTSRVEPGKKIRAKRRASSESAGVNNNPNEAEAEIARSDLSFFLADPIAARRAALALEQMVKVCGGKEWPDEDDLP